MTTIHSILDKTPLTLDADLSYVVVGITGSDGRVNGGCYERAALLDAVRSELGVEIFDKAVLAPMNTEQATALVQASRGINRAPNRDDLASAVSSALSLLSAVHHLEAHPPVDEQQVEALAEILWTSAQTSSGPGDYWDEATDQDRNRFRNKAGRVLASGKVTVQS